MQLSIIYKPVDLTYEQFCEIDNECFPFDAFNFGMFNEMYTNHFWAAFIDNIIVGYAYVLVNSHNAHLSRIAVCQRYRRIGIANELIKTIISYCFDNNLSSISLYVQTDNQPAIKLYEKFAFKYMESSYQFIIPIREVISKYKGSRVHKLTAIPMPQNNVNSEACSENKQHDNSNIVPKRYKLNFIDNNSIVYGNCCLDPEFPGCLPFTITDPENYFIDALIALEEYLNPTKEILILTFSEKDLMKTCCSLGFRLNYELIKMQLLLYYQK